MAAIDPTARYVNAKARINSYVAGLSIHGAPQIVIDGQTQTDPGNDTLFIRIQLEPLQEIDAGNFSATQRAFRAAVLILVDCFCPTGSLEPVYDAYTVDRVADDVAHALRLMSLGFNDYSSDPASPTSVADAPIRVVNGPPQIIRLPTVDGFARRQVTATAEWFVRHTV